LRYFIVGSRARGQRVAIAQLIVVGILVLPTLLLAQLARQTRTLIVNGHSGEVALVQIEGHSYVELEALARLGSGSLKFNGSQVLLTLPSTAGSADETSTTASLSSSALSRDFLKAGIEQMAVIREWRIALTNAVERGYPVAEDWVAAYRNQATQNLRLASLAASTDGDRSAVQLLGNELQNMSKLTERFLEANRSRSYVSPEALKGDRLDQKILDCGHGLAAMAASGHFVDEPSCH
jgi:hypothetical protein